MVFRLQGSNSQDGVGPRKNMSGSSRALAIFTLVVAGEMIFSLPFHVARFFRPTVLDVFDLSNAALGDIFAFYGVLAMLAYPPGGILADHFSARKLLSLSLLATAAGGCYLAVIPSQSGMYALFAFWGVTSILLFWGALIRATREWGGKFQQGRAFGLLEGGRGLVAAVFASMAVWLFSLLLAEPTGETGTVQQRQAMQAVILFYTLATALTAALVWFFVPETPADRPDIGLAPLRDLNHVIRRRVVWLQAAVVVCAYCGYKGLDNYGLYANQVLGMDEVEAARFISLAAYLRPVAAILVGLLADRFTASRMVSLMFLLLAVGYALLSLLFPSLVALVLIYANLVVTFFAVYALRGIYFALLEETGIDAGHTGAAVGLISFIGFTPDVFFASLAGRILDASPGIVGHQLFFSMLVGFAVIGLLSSLVLLSGFRRKAFT